MSNDQGLDEDSPTNIPMLSSPASLGCSYLYPMASMLNTVIKNHNPKNVCHPRKTRGSSDSLARTRRLDARVRGHDVAFLVLGFFL